MTDADKAVEPEPPRVVLAPDVVGGLWLDPACAAVFAAWGDGKLRPAVNRDLLVRYVRLWRSLGLPEIQVRRWSWWFTSPLTSAYLADDASKSSGAIDCCSTLAVRSEARCVVHRGAMKPPLGGVIWLPADEYLRTGG